MVIVGHGMGGLISKMMVTEAGDSLWRVVSDRPFGALAGEKADIDLFREGLLFQARPEVRRVIFIAMPHRGSHVDRGTIQHVGARLVRVADDPRPKPPSASWPIGPCSSDGASGIGRDRLRGRPPARPDQFFRDGPRGDRGSIELSHRS
jgi:hypothetical protein